MTAAFAAVTAVLVVAFTPSSASVATQRNADATTSTAARVDTPTSAVAAAVPTAAPETTTPTSEPAAAAPVAAPAEVAASATAPAVLYDTADTAPGWQQRKGEAALAQIGFPWQSLGVRIEFMAAKSGYRAGMFPHENLIEVYVRDSLSVDEIALDIAHELGHAFDWVRMDTASRATFKQIRGYGDRPGGWFACSRCTDFMTPAGDFAETFAYWVLGGRMAFRGQIVPAPTAEQLALLQPLFAR